jgi:hypothetical protein
MDKKVVFIINIGFSIILIILGIFAYQKYSLINDQFLEIQKERDLMHKQMFYRDSLMLELNRTVELNVNKFLLEENDSIMNIDIGLFIYVPNGICFGCIENTLVRLIQSLKSLDLKLTILCHHDNERGIYLFKQKNNLNINIRNVDNEYIEQNINKALDELTFFIIDRKNNGAIAYINSGYFDSFKLLASFLKYRY